MSDAPEQRAADRREIEKLHPGERFQMMLDEPTPETDAEAMDGEYRYQGSTITLHEWDYRKTPDGDVVTADFARRLERERNEARRNAEVGSQVALQMTARLHAVADERDQLRARVAELEGALDKMTKNRDTVLQRLLDQSK